jgi:hypothetical protein
LFRLWVLSILTGQLRNELDLSSITPISLGDDRMSGSHEWFWEQAARLFAMAGEAREQDDAELADLLTEGARHCLDRHAEHEGVEANLSGPSVRIH